MLNSCSSFPLLKRQSCSKRTRMHAFFACKYALAHACMHCFLPCLPCLYALLACIQTCVAWTNKQRKLLHFRYTKKVKKAAAHASCSGSILEKGKRSSCACKLQQQPPLWTYSPQPAKAPNSLAHVCMRAPASRDKRRRQQQMQQTETKPVDATKTEAN